MPDNKLSIGTHFIYRGREYVIDEYLSNDEFRIMDLITKEYDSKSENWILNALFEGVLEITGRNQNLAFLTQKLKKTCISDITLLSDNDPRKTQAYRRKAYVYEMISQGVTVRTSQSLAPIIQTVSKRINDLNP